MVKRTGENVQKEFKEFSLEPTLQGDEKNVSMRLIRGGVQSCGAPVCFVGCRCVMRAHKM